MIKSERHLLYCGWVAGIAARNGVPLHPMMDELGNYTDELCLALPHHFPGRVVVVVPEPPDDWALGG